MRYWAGARAAAGVDTEVVDCPDVRTLTEDLRLRRPALGPVLEVASLLVDGQVATESTRLRTGGLVEVLPPFAGG